MKGSVENLAHARGMSFSHIDCFGYGRPFPGETTQSLVRNSLSGSVSTIFSRVTCAIEEAATRVVQPPQRLLYRTINARPDDGTDLCI